ncbi:MAG TPA: hypothetical protein DIU18_00175 [Gemmatimonadetes bacterium]|nr:hypothetical protein [Gemmatimonadota bacterium]|tara:strand:- start:1635 stop:1871 length:237 start_codon:yes stop_codon:yes gene_type:complete
MSEATAELLFTFDTTHMALWAEDTARERSIPAEIVPAPPESKAKCGLALRMAAKRADELSAALHEEGVRFSTYEGSTR